MKPKLHPCLFALIFFVPIAAGLPCAQATVIEVPDHHASISSAIAAASNGDTIRVAPGTYLENIDFAGKAITVRGHYQPGGDWTLVETTIIDGSQPSSEDEASTVTFDSGEGRNSVLQGLTITGGRGSVWVDPSFPTYTWRGGGGIFIFGSSPTIRHSLVSGNQADNGGSVDGAQGGGVLCFGGNPLIHNSIITANHAEYGGGLVVDYSGAVVRNTVISHNTCGTPYGGAGIWTIGSSSDPIELTNCVIADNISPTRAGALYVWRSTVSLHNSVIWGNQQNFDPAVFTVDGGQIEIDHSNVEGGAGGDGNIDLDPAFSDAATFLLDPGSPCTDAGDPRTALNDPEDPTSAGQARWPATGGLRNDMGAYGGPGSLPMSRVEPADAHVDSPITVAWEFNRSDGALLEAGSTSLPALGNTQVNRLFEAYAPVEAAYADVWTPTDGAAIACYGSVVDNTTNDPTTVLPQ